MTCHFKAQDPLWKNLLQGEKNGESIEGQRGARVGCSPSTPVPAPSSIPGPTGGCHHPWGSGQPRVGAQLHAGGTWRGQEHPLGALQEGPKASSTPTPPQGSLRGGFPTLQPQKGSRQEWFHHDHRHRGLGWRSNSFPLGFQRPPGWC